MPTKTKKICFAVIGAIFILILIGAGSKILLNNKLTPKASALKPVSNIVPDNPKLQPAPSKPDQAPVSKPANTTQTNKTAGGIARPTQAYAPIYAKPGVQLYANPSVTNLINNSAISLPASDAAVLQHLASQPTAAWFGNWSGDIQTAVSSYVSNAANAGKVPVLVAYNIPNRDCGGQSAGGLGDAANYQAWIQGFANGIGGRSAIVILEPDAVAAECFNTPRADMLNAAIQTLRASSQAIVYLDAGHANWRSAGDMAARLNQSGLAAATGFSLNVSNFQTTSSNINYGNQISGLTGGKHFVIDTSRNGPTADNQWCNPDGRALGASPTTQTGNALVDAYLWVKVPGESDGTCGPMQGGTNPPPAGTHWSQYALMLARNAGW